MTEDERKIRNYVADGLTWHDAIAKRRREVPNAKLDLRSARFANLDLTRVQLGGADLRDADLQNTRLYAASFKYADLRGADFRGAVGFDKASFDGANTQGMLC